VIAVQIERKIAEHGVYKIRAKEKVLFPKVNEQEIKKSFEFYKSTGMIIAKSFNDVEWRYVSKVYNTPFRILFDLDLYRDFNKALRSFVIIRIISSAAPNTVCLEQRYLKRAILLTSGFKNFDPLYSYLAQVSKPEANRIARSLKMFNDYYPVVDPLEVNNICATYSGAMHGNRDLPSFTDVMTYDKYVSNFFTEEPLTETGKYLVVWLWWKLTNVLPMRPSELCMLESNCLVERENGTSWLRFRRIKTENYETDNENTSYFEKQYSLIQIDNSISKLISDYKFKLTQLRIESDYLLPYELRKLGNKVNFLRADNPERIDLFVFRDVLKKFHKHIIQEKYGQVDCSRINPGDTRHFAIINMFLQGFNALSIARMAGHKSISMQVGYYSHAIFYAESFVYALAQRKFETGIENKIPKPFLGKTRRFLDSCDLVSDDEILSLRPVDFGFCRDKSEFFPINCSDDCRKCEYFLFKPTFDATEQALAWLRNYSVDIGNKITETIKIMFDIGKSVEKYNEKLINEALRTNSIKLASHMDYKAIVDARLLEVETY
jgi:hypothetical protein